MRRDLFILIIKLDKQTDSQLHFKRIGGTSSEKRTYIFHFTYSHPRLPRWIPSIVRADHRTRLQ